MLVNNSVIATPKETSQKTTLNPEASETNKRMAWLKGRK